jgi:hypothetical protein
MKLHLILGVLVLVYVITTSCSKQDSFEMITGKTILFYDSDSSKLTDIEFKYDSLVVERISKDSMTITRYLGGEGYYYHSNFSLKNDVFYENRIVPQLIIEGETETKVIFIPTFSLKDTIFNYTPEDDFTSVFVMDLSFDKCIYQIEKKNNKVLTIKKSLVDTTYKEIFFYDKDYNIYKYINTWQNNKCVYVKKE